VVCRDCGKVLEIRFNSRSGEIQETPPEAPPEGQRLIELETVY
jgi:hypothetical protein